MRALALEGIATTSLTLTLVHTDRQTPVLGEWQEGSQAGLLYRVIKARFNILMRVASRVIYQITCFLIMLFKARKQVKQ